MRSFRWIYEHALARKGSIEALEALLPVPKTEAQLLAMTDDRYLSDMVRRVFRAGLKHSMVDAKWPAFEQVFYGFNPRKIVLMSDDMLEQKMQDKSIIRHWGKIKSVRTNAFMVDSLSREKGSFGRFLADWPADNIIGLWQHLAKSGAHLGGSSAPSFLRMVGKDTFILSNDNVAALKAQGIIDKKPTGKKALQDVQYTFNQWHAESGRPYCQISRLLSFCAD
jgi:3-methyladenine DNA glycosylase Tag